MSAAPVGAFAGGLARSSPPAPGPPRFHWSYAPVAEAALDFTRANESVIADALDKLWSYDPVRFSCIRANWRNYVYHVNEKAHFGYGPS